MKQLLELVASGGADIDIDQCDQCMILLREELLLKCDICEEMFCNECLDLETENGVQVYIKKQCDTFTCYYHYYCTQECLDEVPICNISCDLTQLQLQTSRFHC
jgi:hypothetical protein